jgi:TPR repeat protein
LAGPRDLESAEVWYRKAAAQNHMGAQLLLAEALTASHPPTEDGLAEIFGLWLAVAAAGNPVAQRNAAQCYLEGRGCEADPIAATRWFRAAADQGDAEAEFQLGRCYRRGRGVRRNSAEGRFWLERASAQGHAGADALLSGR